MHSAQELHQRAVDAVVAGRVRAARRPLLTALARSSDDALTGRIETTLAYVEAETGNRDGAMALCDRAVARVGLEPSARALVYRQRGLLKMLAGDDEAAISDLSAAIAALRDPREVGRALGNRGTLYLQRREHRRAIEDFLAAMGAYAEAGDEIEAAMIEHNLGYARYLAGDLVGALSAMERARVILAPLSPVAEATCDQDRAEVLMATGLEREANAALNAAALAYGAAGLRRRRAEAELTHARAVLLSDPHKSLSSARTAARRFGADGTEAMRTRALATALAAKVALGESSSRAAEDGERLGAALDVAGLPWIAAATRLNTARVYVRRGRIDSARLAVEPLRVHRAPLDVRLLAADVRAELSAAQGKRAAAFGHLRRGLADLHAWQSSFGSLDLQTNVAGHGRALAMRGLELAVESRRPTTLFEWSERARMLASRIQPVRAPRNEEIAAGLAELRSEVTPEREAELRSRIRELAWQHEGSREVVDPVPLEALQAELADGSLVAYVAASERLVALHVTATKTTWHDLGDTAEVKRLLGGLLPDLDVAASELPAPMASAVRGELVARLARLRELLVDPLSLDDGPIVLTPSGLLAGVPWSLLLPGRPVTVGQSATSWLGRRTTPLRLNRAGFVVGPRVARAEGEVLAAAKEWAGATVVVGAEATADEVTALASRVDVLHVAAHGRHSSENPLFSGLQLADGTWFGYDIDQLSSVPDVVLLSACEVGRSSVRWGEELIGMTAAWLHAGARCVVASPAAVNDEAAYDVLVALHRGLATGLDPAAALGAAVAPASADRPPAPFVCFG